MKLKFETAFRAGLLFFVFTLAWSLWASAQTNTNKLSLATTNQPSALVEKVEHLEEHPLTFGLDRLPLLRDQSVFGEPLWKYAASLVYILLAFYASKLLDFVARIWLRKLASRTETKLDDLLLELLHGPLKVIAFVVLLNIGLGIFDWSPRAKLYLSKALILVVAASLTYLAVKVTELLLDAWRRRHGQGEKIDHQLFSALRITLNTFVIIVALLITAQNLDINITAAIASLSIGGLAVGLAAQDTLANIFGAVSVFVDKPFRVGEHIKLEGAEGAVEAVGLRSTRLRNPDGHLVAIPNKTMGNSIITNLSRRPTIKTTMNLNLAPDLPIAKIKQALTLLQEIYRGHEGTQEAWVSFNQFAGARVNILIVHWWKGTDYQKYLTGMQEMNLAVKDRFEREGIALA
ncbi:MAG TPA: mechanosensitive ion channel family protein [Candidatus Acidoferrum sp.]|jgi:MscS family membrane protein|nr:mechanosensitive ion channel family protein [Candidatus Acidoferrum sp.]